jgi:cephalosporin-C deacetylase
MTVSNISHGYGFDPAYGMDLAQLLAIVPPEPPPDYVNFWQARYEAALSVEPQPNVEQAMLELGGYAVHDLHYTSTGGIGIGGWLLVPREGRVSRGAIIGHGYAGDFTPSSPLALPETALIYPCFRGLGRSPVPGVSQEPYYHVLHDIDDRDRYILGGCVEDLWLAVSSMLALFPQVAGRIAFLGVSFSGGIGAMAAPWDARIARLHLEVPSFGHQALRLTLPCVGSGESVRNLQSKHGFNVMETLAYYDAATAARYLRIPTLIAAAMFDPAVPPPGQFAIHNAIAQPLRRLFLLDAGHFDYPGRMDQQEELGQELVSFLTML